MQSSRAETGIARRLVSALRGVPARASTNQPSRHQHHTEHSWQQGRRAQHKRDTGRRATTGMRNDKPLSVDTNTTLVKTARGVHMVYDGTEAICYFIEFEYFTILRGYMVDKLQPQVILLVLSRICYLRLYLTSPFPDHLTASRAALRNRPKYQRRQDTMFMRSTSRHHPSNAICYAHPPTIFFP